LKLTDEDRRALADVFASDAVIRAERVELHLDELETAADGRELDEARFSLAHEAHNLRGAAATVGLPQIEQAARALEEALERLAMPGEDRSAAVAAAGRLLSVLRSMATDPAAAGASDRSSAQFFVLHIEDNASNLKLVERILSRRPAIRLVEARDGETGLDLARRVLPELILLDLRLPGISGEEVMRRLREDPATRGIPTVVVSAEARPAESDRLLAAGADDYLVKPIDVENLLAIVDSRLSGNAE